MLTQSCKFSHGLCWNDSLQVWLICNQRYQVLLFRYINWDHKVPHFFRGWKVLGDMKYLMRSGKLAVEAVGICTENSRYMKRVN